MNNETTSVKKWNLVITRVFDAPVERVWRAWSEPELVMQWWGPEHFTCPSAVMDFRTGGSAVVCMRAPAEFGGMDMYSLWRYRKIIPLQEIDFVQSLSDEQGNVVDPASLGMEPGFPQDSRSTIAFKALADGRTELTVTEYDYTSQRWYDLSKAGMEQCLDKMAAALK